MKHQCELVDQRARPTLVVRTRTAVEQLPQVLGPAWGKIMAVAGRVGAEPADPPFVAYHSVDMRDLDIEIGFTFAQPIEGEGDVEAGEIWAGRAVQCIHQGPYDQLHSTYRTIEDWMAERGLRHAGPAYEYYLDDPQGTAPADLQTRIVMPVQ
jgi:effector-binding domain-containing protein